MKHPLRPGLVVLKVLFEPLVLFLGMRQLRLQQLQGAFWVDERG